MAYKNQFYGAVEHKKHAEQNEILLRINDSNITGCILVLTGSQLDFTSQVDLAIFFNLLTNFLLLIENWALPFNSYKPM